MAVRTMSMAMRELFTRGVSDLAHGHAEKERHPGEWVFGRDIHGSPLNFGDPNGSSFPIGPFHDEACAFGDMGIGGELRAQELLSLVFALRAISLFGRDVHLQCFTDRLARECLFQPRNDSAFAVEV